MDQYDEDAQINSNWKSDIKVEDLIIKVEPRDEYHQRDDGANLEMGEII